jgi:hypothetical protein
MSTEGYWAICEEFTLPIVNGMRPSSISMIYVRGFFYADAMGHTRMEALRRVHEKLKENIRFLLACGADLPPLYASDSVPRDYHKKENATLIFISLKDIGLEHISAEQKKQIAAG